MSCAFIWEVAPMRFFVSLYSVCSVPIVMRGIHALQYIEITIQHATVCYSAFELKF